MRYTTPFVFTLVVGFNKLMIKAQGTGLVSGYEVENHVPLFHVSNLQMICSFFSWNLRERVREYQSCKQNFEMVPRLKMKLGTKPDGEHLYGQIEVEQSQIFLLQSQKNS